MRSTINQTIQVGLIAFLLVWACTGCASLNEKIAAVLGLEAIDTTSAETEPLAPAEAKDTTSTETEPPAVTEAKPTPPVETKLLVPVEAAPAAPEETQVAPPNEIKAEPPQKLTYYIHTVKWNGESLSIIAKWYTGNLENWEALAQANPNLTPSRLFIGSRIRIPENVLKTRDPMPQEFVTSFYPKPKRKSLPPETTPPPPSEEEEEKLFGPKHYPKK